MSCRLDEQITTDVLLDNGSDISVISRSWVINNIRHPHLYALDTRILCYPYYKDPTRRLINERADDDAVMIREVFYAEVEFLSFKFHFPIHAHPDDIPLFILGNDYLSMVDISINVATTTIKIPKFRQFRSEMENDEALSKQGGNEAFEYLIANLALLTAGKAERRDITTLASREVKGLELNHNVFFHLPQQSHRCLGVTASTTTLSYKGYSSQSRLLLCNSRCIAFSIW